MGGYDKRRMIMVGITVVWALRIFSMCNIVCFTAYSVIDFECHYSPYNTQGKFHVAEINASELILEKRANG